MGGSRLTCSRAIHFHFGARVVTFVAFLQPLSMSTSIRSKGEVRGGPRPRRREKNKASLACSIQKLFSACVQKEEMEIR